SFSDGGAFTDPETACTHAEEMVRDGADIVDIGGESTRPGALALSADEEWRRIAAVLPLPPTRGQSPISIDTYKSTTARKALEAGARIVNDVWGFQQDPDMARVVADFGAGAVLMHNRRAADPSIRIMEDVVSFLSRSVDTALASGIREDQIVVDPGV